MRFEFVAQSMPFLCYLLKQRRGEEENIDMLTLKNSYPASHGYRHSSEVLRSL